MTTSFSSCIDAARRVALGMAVGAVSLLSACALKSPPPVAEVREQALGNMSIPPEWASAAAAHGTVESGWLSSFDDPALRALVDEAFVYNLDLRKAASRVEQASAYVRIAGGALYPAVSVSGRKGTDSSGDDSALAGAIVSASWELDLWGRVRYGVRSSRDEHSAAEYDYAFARLSLAGLVAKSWFVATEASLQVGLSREMEQSALMLLELAENRLRVGAGSEMDVTLARLNVDTYRDQLAQLELARQQSLRALEVLLGRYPSATLSASASFPVLLPAVPAGVPSELLERRPDIIAAERRMEAAFFRVQQARAARLPTLSISGSGLDLSSDLLVLQDREYPVWSLGGRILAPLFTGGALKAQVQVRSAEQSRTVADYAATVLTAFQDVENAMSSELSMRSREDVLTRAMTDAQRALRLAETRYRIGVADLRSVQEQQLDYHSVRMNLLRVRSERRIQRVNLHLALGGSVSPAV